MSTHHDAWPVESVTLLSRTVGETQRSLRKLPLSMNAGTSSGGDLRGTGTAGSRDYRTISPAVRSMTKTVGFVFRAQVSM